MDPDDRSLQRRILDEIAAERARPDAKWGPDLDHPSVDPVLMGRTAGCSPERMCAEYEIPTEDRAKGNCEREHSRPGGRRLGTFASVLVEEVSEAVSAAVESDAACRKELVQVAAVVVKWIEAIDGRSR